MEYRWITKINEFQEIAAQWDEALLFSKEDNPFLLSPFLLSWWKYYSAGLKFRAFVLYDDKNIVGGLPLCENKNGYLEYPGGITANYTEVMSLKNSQDLWKYLLEALSRLGGWRCVRLDRIRKSRLNADRINSAVLEQKNILLDLHRSEYSYSINIPEKFSDYTKVLPKKLRYYIRRSESEFAKLGKVSLCSFKDYDEISALTDTYISFSSSSFKKRNNQSAFENKTYCLFFKELISRMYQSGYLDVNALKLNGRIIAIHFGYSLGNNLNYVFPAFDIEFADLNPGHLLIYKLIELGEKRKNKIFDFYTGYSFYKRQWCNAKEEVFLLEMRPNTLRGKVEGVIAKQIRSSPIINKSRESIRNSKALMPLARKIKALIRPRI